MLLLSAVIVVGLVGSRVNALLLDGNENGGPSDIQYLHLLIADEKQQRMTLQQSLTALEQRVSGIATEQCACQTVRGPVGFMAALGKNLVNPAQGHVVVFDQVVTNVGGAYSTVHGIFTAPVNGTYHFTVVGSSPSSPAAHQIHLFLMQDGVQKAYLFLDDNTTHWLRGSMVSVLQMTKGQEVWVQVDNVLGDHTLAGTAFHTTFSGFLVQQN